jgi:hypothetical protein
MKLNVSGCRDHPVHVSGFGGKDPDMLELDLMAQADAVFS